MRRLKLEVTMWGGKLSDNILQATHLVIISLPELCLNFDMLLKSFSAADRHLLCSNKLHIVSSQWLEDCCERGQKLPEDSYSLKPMNFEAYVMKERKDESTLDDNTVKHVVPAPAFEDEPEEKIASLNESTTSMPPKRDAKRKQRPRGRTTSTRLEATVKQPRRAKFGSKPARIDMNETSESDDSSVGISQKYEFGGSDKEENCDFDMHIDDSRKPMIDRNETKTRHKITVKQSSRAKVGSKPAKIKDDETNESDDALVRISQKHEFGRGDKEETCDFDMNYEESRKPKIVVNETTRQKLTVKQPRRAKVGSKSAKINDNETNESDDASVGISQKHEFGMIEKEENREFDTHNDEIIHKSRPEIPLSCGINDSKMLTQGKEFKESLDFSRDGEEKNVSRTLDHNSHHDPFRSILQPNMLSCHEKEPSSSTAPLECENQVPGLDTNPNNSMNVDTHENPQIDLTPNPLKKKKVSFRSLAAELLKDW
ncbi:hypothetical protein DM860_015969 [Cuscuta australis]|uniref:BRCT domain-containing protein n=1 Tax=Cuscuta australis TaxID=267555 RepID=A0A328DYP1_9ASTE|nr:hypothetical protein DM860_015969 [Cuscuta australis]